MKAKELYLGEGMRVSSQINLVYFGSVSGGTIDGLKWVIILNNSGNCMAMPDAVFSEFQNFIIPRDFYVDAVTNGIDFGYLDSSKKRYSISLYFCHKEEKFKKGNCTIVILGHDNHGNQVSDLEISYEDFKRLRNINLRGFSRFK